MFGLNVPIWRGAKCMCWAWHEMLVRSEEEEVTPLEGPQLWFQLV